MKRFIIMTAMMTVLSLSFAACAGNSESRENQEAGYETAYQGQPGKEMSSNPRLPYWMLRSTKNSAALPKSPAAGGTVPSGRRKSQVSSGAAPSKNSTPQRTAWPGIKMRVARLTSAEAPSTMSPCRTGLRPSE